MTPLVNNPKIYPTRTCFKGTLLLDLSHILLRRKYRIQERLVSGQLAFNTLADIHKKFINSSNKGNMDSFSTFDFTNIAGYPNQMLAEQCANNYKKE